MAVFAGSPTSSVQYAAQLQMGAKAEQVNADLKFAEFHYVHAAGAGTGVINLVKLPAGRLNILPDLSRYSADQMVATADLHFGYAAHTKADGTAVPADDNAFADNLDAGGGAIAEAAFALPAGLTLPLDSREGVLIQAMVDTANIEDGDKIDGYIVYTMMD